MKRLLTPAVEQLLRDACYQERYASNLYTHLANQMQRVGYFGAEKFFRGEASDELEHYQRIVQYFNDRGGMAPVPAIEEMDEKANDLAMALNAAFQTEVDLGALYAKWYSQCLPQDPTTAQFLLQFIEIQRTSIGEFGDWLSRLERCGQDNAALLILDRELGE